MTRFLKSYQILTPLFAARTQSTLVPLPFQARGHVVFNHITLAKCGLTAIILGSLAVSG